MLPSLKIVIPLQPSSCANEYIFLTSATEASLLRFTVFETALLVCFWNIDCMRTCHSGGISLATGNNLDNEPGIPDTVLSEPFFDISSRMSWLRMQFLLRVLTRHWLISTNSLSMACLLPINENIGSMLGVVPAIMLRVPVGAMLVSVALRIHSWVSARLLLEKLGNEPLTLARCIDSCLASADMKDIMFSAILSAASES